MAWVKPGTKTVGRWTPKIRIKIFICILCLVLGYMFSWVIVSFITCYSHFCKSYSKIHYLSHNVKKVHHYIIGFCCHLINFWSQLLRFWRVLHKWWFLIPIEKWFINSTGIIITEITEWTTNKLHLKLP